LSHFIMKIKNFMKYFKEEVLKCFKISKLKYFIVHLYFDAQDVDASARRHNKLYASIIK